MILQNNMRQHDATSLTLDARENLIKNKYSFDAHRRLNVGGNDRWFGESKGRILATSSRDIDILLEVKIIRICT